MTFILGGGNLQRAHMNCLWPLFSLKIVVHLHSSSIPQSELVLCWMGEENSHRGYQNLGPFFCFPHVFCGGVLGWVPQSSSRAVLPPPEKQFKGWNHSPSNHLFSTTGGLWPAGSNGTLLSCRGSGHQFKGLLTRSSIIGVQKLQVNIFL